MVVRAAAVAGTAFHDLAAALILLVALAGALAVAFSLCLDVTFAFAGTLAPAAGVVFLVEDRRGGVSAVAGLATVSRRLAIARSAAGPAGRSRRWRERERRFVRLRLRRGGYRGRCGRVADRVGVLDIPTP